MLAERALCHPDILLWNIDRQAERCGKVASVRIVQFGRGRARLTLVIADR